MLRKIETFILLPILFFLNGFLTSLNGAMVPIFKNVYHLSYSMVSLIIFSFFIAYFFFSLPAGSLIARLDFKKIITINLFLISIFCWILTYSTAVMSYFLFISSWFLLACSIVFIEVSINPYIVLMTQKNNHYGNLNFMQTFNSLGTVIGPYSIVILYFFVYPLLASQNNLGAIHVLYIILGFFTLTLTFITMIYFKDQKNAVVSYTTKGNLIVDSDLLLSFLGIFVYVGCEVTIATFLVIYLIQPEIGNLATYQAEQCLSAYWLGMLLGRLGGSYIIKKINAGFFIFIVSLGAFFLLMVALVMKGLIAAGCIISLGLLNSIIFPTIFSLVIPFDQRVNAAKRSGFLSTAIVGGAIIPLLQGYIADHIGVNMSFIVPAVLYLYLAFYGQHFWKKYHEKSYFKFSKLCS